MKLDTKTGALILAAVAMVIIIFIAAFVAKNPIGQHAGQRSGNQAGVSPTYASRGQLVAGFPKELILDSGAQFSSSYSINYFASLNQYTAEWSSSSSMAALYANYQDYFLKNHWTILNKMTAGKAWRGLYATNGSHDVNVAIVIKDKGSQVTIGYLQK